ncbi:hypothetical protein [Amycolatopsis suaedae]|uniref:Uncharacterized protein n=1 Tax=Amycolatopsis suaedae TaxID=2510978 RepID=A0A4Q7JA13_9PSEU|nr:hypothetical protein [Amycolatopsis suaedae]RZQ63796.1 hypothetical protein EWH70_11570 [Amycolatopsis suaedae]
MSRRRRQVGSIADLARAGFQIARQSLTTVDFEVHHVEARPGYLRGLAPFLGDAPFLEALCSAANGGGVAIGTRTGEASAAMTGRPADGQRRCGREDVPGGWVFQHSAWPNPTFVYESAHTFEGLISVDRTARKLTDRHGTAVRELLEGISEVAANLAGAPLLTLQCPAQLPTVVKTRHLDLRTRKELPSAYSSLAVRFSVALTDNSAERQFLLGNHLRELCERRGYGFWVSDTRPGHRPGNWFQVCRSRPGFEPAADEQVTTCLPLTCVGPARVGSTHAIVTFLRRYPQVGVVGCSGTSLDDLAFIHLQLSVDGVAAGRVNRILRKLLDGPAPPPTRPHELLAALFHRLGLRGCAETAPADESTHPASDYQALLGPAFDYRPASTSDSLAIWVSWQMAHSPAGLAGPLECLYRAMAETVPVVGPQDPVPLSEVATVEYLVCRATEQSVVRGKAKLAVPKVILRQFSADDVQPPASLLCDVLEDSWKAHVERIGLTGVGELTVAWREFWLG